MVKNKICTKCGKQKLLSKFHNDRLSKNGLKAACKECANCYSREYYYIHETERKNYSQKYRKTLIGRLRMCFYFMRHRCNNSKNKRYKHYGGRGIKCLFKSSQEFVDYVLNELKIDPCGLIIDRIDNDGNYEKGNIRFVTIAENNRNKRKMR